MVFVSLDNCLVTEIRSQGEKCFLNCIYGSPSQSHDEFDDFCTKFDLLVNNINHEFPLCSIVTGDFSARYSRWWQNDITNSAGQEIFYKNGLSKSCDIKVLEKMNRMCEESS